MEYKQLFLADLLKTEGTITRKAIVARAKAFEEFRFEQLKVELYTRDQALVSTDLSFHVMLENEQLFKRMIEETRATNSESVKSFVIREIRDYVQSMHACTSITILERNFLEILLRGTLMISTNYIVLLVLVLRG